MAINPFVTMDCPKRVTWKDDIRKMFTDDDVAHMKQARNLDLGDYKTVKIWATKIYNEVAAGDMPPPGSGENAWTVDMVNTFGCWVKQGCLEQ